MRFFWMLFFFLHTSFAAAKLTAHEPDKSANLQLKIEVTFEKVTPEEQKKFAGQFLAQAKTALEPCLKPGGKPFVGQLKGAFAFARAGHLRSKRVDQVTPPNSYFEQCFLKYIQGLDIGPQPKRLIGGVTLETYLGQNPDDKSQKPVHYQ